MATAKKKTTTTKKTPAKKKTTTRKAPAKSTQSAAARTSKKRSNSTFLTMTPTVETVYWIILGVVVILLAIWVLTLTARINNLYDQINIRNASNAIIMPTEHTSHHATTHKQ